MDLLIQTVLSFPTIVFAGLLGLVGLYWLLVALRLLPVEFFEHDSLRDDHLSSTLVSLGLGGVPASFALTVLLGLGFAICLALELLVLRFLPLGFFRAPLGLVVIWASLALAAPFGVALCHALQHWLHHFRGSATRCLLGQTVVVQTPTDKAGLCRARLEDDPQVIVTLHGKHKNRPQVGERQVLVKYLAGEQTYRSVPKHRYLEAHDYVARLRLAHRQANPRRRRHAH